jgi:hypothetical protein
MLSLVSFGQTGYVIRGTVTDSSGQPVPYANIVIRELPDSSLVGGTISGEQGHFSFKHKFPGEYLCTASFIGYESGSSTIHLIDGVKVDSCSFVLNREPTVIDELVIRENRLKAKQGVDRTTYYMNKKLYAASQTGTDLMNMIPGVNVDLFNRISLDGSSRIIILIDGVRRNTDYLAQLSAERIDRIEILPSGGTYYGSGITGVINVILKQERTKGISSHVYANIPTKSDEVFSFPTASISYSGEKSTWYTSYDGGFSYFNIEGSHSKKATSIDQPLEIVRQDKLSQENWSHKGHFGMDHLSDEKNQFSLYGFVSAFSNEQDGRFEIIGSDGETEPLIYLMEKYDRDRNHSAYGSLFYKHLFKPGTELILEGSYYLLRAKTITRLSAPESSFQKTNQSHPGKDELDFRAHFNSRISERFTIESGMQQQFNSKQDYLFPSFSYDERVSAAYLQGTYKGEILQANTALRVEYNRVLYSNILDRESFLMLPQADLKYTINNKNSIKIRYAKQVNRPDIYHLNPNPFAPDPYTLQRGNPHLLPEIKSDFSLMYNLSFSENFLSAGVFYRLEKGIMEDLTKYNGAMTFLSEKQNLGDLHHAGVKMLGSMNLHDRFSVGHQLECYQVHTRGSDLAKNEGVENTIGIEFKGKISAIWAIRDDLSVSASLQGQSVTTGIQHEYREGLLYFINVEKVFLDHLKVTLTSAIPFMRSFTYQGHEVSRGNMTETSEANIIMSMVPVWFKFSYSFASGNRIRRLKRDNVFQEKREKRGF